MTDPNETANLVDEITEAFREHLAEEAAKRPQTYQEAASGSLPEQIDRYRQLADREMTARSIATLQARGEWTEDRARVLDPGKYPPLTVAEHLEMIALGERIARYYRHPSQVDRAARAGASWVQIAAAAGTTEEAARDAYREWAAGQYKYAGMTEADYAEALKLAERDRVVFDVRDDDFGQEG
jgi:hypothetical protein